MAVAIASVASDEWRVASWNVLTCINQRLDGKIKSILNPLLRGAK